MSSDNARFTTATLRINKRSMYIIFNCGFPTTVTWAFLWQELSELNTFKP